jgi:acyl carrier protein
MNYDEIFKLVKDEWKEVLETDEEIDADTAFFELGGNSMLANIMVESINNKLGTAVEISDIYEHNTITLLTEYLVSKVKEH